MELEKVIKYLDMMKNKIDFNLTGWIYGKQAIETVLEELENSIPKKKIEDKINKRVAELDAERDDNLDYASDYDYEIQLWEEMKQELLEGK